MRLSGAGKRRGGGRFSRRQGASLARRVAAGGRDALIPSAVNVAERQGAQAVSAHARVVSGRKHTRSPLETGVGRVAGHSKERTLGGAFKMAASSGSDWAITGALEERSLGVANKMAAPIIVDNTEVVVISDDEESIQQGQRKEDQVFDDAGLVSRRGVEWEAQPVHRFVSPMINKVQSWQKDNEAAVGAGEQVDVFAGCGSCGSLFSGRVGDEVIGDKLVGKAYGSMDVLQSGAGEGTSGCGTPYALGGHRARAIYQPSGRMVGDRSVLVKARAPSEHQPEERVRSGAVRLTSGDSMRAAEVQPSTSQGAGVGWADWEELLDYDEDLEEPVVSTKRVMLAEEETGVVQGGHVPVRASGNLPRGEESLVEFLRLHRGLDKVRMVRGARVVRGRLEGGLSSKVDASIQDGSKLLASQFLAVLRLAIKRVGLEPSSYGTHSFRIGAATEARRQGCVGGPDKVCAVWIVGHTFVRWAEKQAASRHFGRQLGLDGSRIRVSWVGKSGMRWARLPYTLVGSREDSDRAQDLRGRCHQRETCPTRRKNCTMCRAEERRHALMGNGWPWGPDIDLWPHSFSPCEAGHYGPASVPMGPILPWGPLEI
ncbi:hypothetical protein NDU88_003786 [Pleurodeles waltl]|uniref:Uncharacterized protein n=1 Tax=Pleurodeles waltl TaxID=8319 RepID=A0AAV7PC63_PLEWA|nr:hypothetical protein NDU88_003786 [Pleurodeles waltl]